MIFNVSAGKPPWQIPTYTGSYAIFGTRAKGYIECYSTGTLTFGGIGKVDLWMMTSGLKGKSGSVSSGVSDRIVSSGSGGAGGVQRAVVYNIPITRGSYSVTVPPTCTSETDTNKPSALGYTITSTSTAGNSGSSASVGFNNGVGYSRSSASAGGNGSCTPFWGDSSEFAGRQYCAGGGGGRCYASDINSTVFDEARANGGAKGGGRGGSTTIPSSGGVGTAGTANTGSGGGGGGSYYAYDGASRFANGGNGGSGLVIIRWGY